LAISTSGLGTPALSDSISLTISSRPAAGGWRYLRRHLEDLDVPDDAFGCPDLTRSAAWMSSASEDLDTYPGTDAPGTIQPTTAPSTVKSPKNRAVPDQN
jgi:hypothetical protein